VAEIRRTAPETRAVLAGLLLVLGAWVGPGLSEAGGPGQVAIQDAGASLDELGEAPLAGDAYRNAVATASPKEAGSADDRPRLTDDQD
jgi:hypothetical protein